MTLTRKTLAPVATVMAVILCAFQIYATGGIGVLVFGLTGAEILPAGWNVFAGWCLFVDGCIGFWAVTAGMLGFCGIRLSCGKPFFREKS